MQPGKGLWALGIALLFWVLFYIGISHHEMWRDELQVWALVKASPSILSLLHNMRYEGHPALWHILVYFVAQFTNSPFSMALLHITIAAAVVFVVFRYSPFSWWQKLLMVSGYYFMYEYAEISRNYSIGLLLVFSICTLFQNRKDHPVVIPLLIFMLCQCNVFCIIITIGFSFVFFIKAISKNEKVALPIILIGSGLLLGAWQIIPPADGTFSNTWSFFPLSDGLKTATRICTSFFPLPRFKHAFWDTCIFTNPYLALVISICISTLCIVRYRSRPHILIFYIFSTFCLWLFFYLRFHGSVRHHGHFYIIFIVCEWLYLLSPNTAGPGAFNKLFNSFFIVVLSTQVIAGIYAYSRDLNDTFSESEAVSAYIKTNGLDSMPVIGFPDYAAAPVMARLNKPFYSLTRKGLMNYTIWDAKRDRSKNDSTLINQARSLADSTRKEYLLIINKQLISAEKYNFIQPAGVFDDAIVPDEIYYLYKVKYNVK